MKKVIVLICMFAMIYIQSAAAESIQTQISFLDAVNEVDKWNNKLYTIAENLENENGIAFINAVLDVSNTATAILSDIGNDEDRISGEIGAHICTEKNIRLMDRSCYFETGTRKIEGMNLYFEHIIEYEENYMQIESFVYRPDGTHIGSRKIEMGQKEDQIVILLIDYDPIENLTGRFAMCTGDNIDNVLFTKTIGETWNIQMDIHSWIADQYEMTWNKYLLMPIGK